MTRSGDRKPSQSPASGEARAQPPRPRQAAGSTEAFGRFVSTLARLEGGGVRGGKGREAGR
jgi:hypothetical protein